MPDATKVLPQALERNSPLRESLPQVVPRTRGLHVLLVHQAYTSLSEAGGTRHCEIASRMVAQGHRFTVIASDVSYLTGVRTVGSEENGPEVRRVFGGFGFHRSYFFRMLSFVAFMLCAAWEGLRVAEIDVVIATSPPMFQAFAGVAIAAFRRRPLLLEIRDLWPEFAIGIGLLKNPILIRASRAMERFLYRRAAHIIVNSPAYRDYLVEKGISSRKISLVANGVDATMFRPNDRGDRFRRQWSLEGKFVVTYAGAMGMANDLDVVLAAADYLQNEPDVVFVLAGDGKERSRLETEAARRGLRNLRFLGTLPKKEIPELLAASDACIAVLRNIPMFRTTYPNKVFDYMAAARPTILCIDGVIREVIDRAGGGIFVPPGDAKSLADAILLLRRDPQCAQQMGAKAREYVSQNFNRDAQAAEFAQVVTSMVRPA